MVVIALAAATAGVASCESGGRRASEPAKDAVVGTAAERPSIEELAARYAAAGSDDERRDIAIRAIDLGYIARGEPVSVVKRLCGSDFDEKVGDDYGIVDFWRPTEEQLRWTAEVKAAPARIGWYLVVHYSAGRTITRYELSNLHK